MSDPNTEIIREIINLRAENIALKNSLMQNRNLIQLPGTKYSRYSLPIEYTPSREYTPRWGGFRPPIEILNNLFSEHTESYKLIFAQMAATASDFLNLNLDWQTVPFCRFDFLALAAILREQRPYLYMEIGSGASTKLARWTIDTFNLGTKIVSIEPNNRGADQVCDVSFPECLESINPELFDQLAAGDILFFDGSHRSFMNSDVTVFMIDVLPRLKPGVVVHVHDITLPYDYPEWAAPWYWNEQYLLAVYLMNARDRIEPVFPTAWLDRSGVMEAHFEDLMALSGGRRQDWVGGGSMWFRIGSQSV